jgi:hypothetical protein
MSYAAEYVNLLNRLAASRSKRLMDVAALTGQAQMQNAETWGRLPGTLATIANQGINQYQDQQKIQIAQDRQALADRMAQQRANYQDAQLEATNRRLDIQTEQAGTTAKTSAEAAQSAAAERARTAGQKWLEVFGGKAADAAEQAITSQEAWDANHQILDDAGRAFSAMAGRPYEPLPAAPTPETLSNIKQSVALWRQGVAKYTSVEGAALSTLPSNFTPEDLAKVQGIVKPPTPGPIITGTPQGGVAPSTLRVNADGTITDLNVRPIPRATGGGGGGTQSGGGFVLPDVVFTRPTREEGVLPVKGTLLTRNGVFQGAIDMALTGKAPTFTRASGPVAALIPATQAAVRNSNAELLARSGMDAGVIKSAYAANAKTLGTMIPRYNQSVGYADSALASLNFAEAAGEKVKRSPTTALNTLRNWWNRDIQGNKELSEFEVYVYSAARDYAKVTSGAEASVAELTVSAAAKADQLLNVSQSPERFAGAIAAMRKDMANAVENRRAKIGETSKVIADFLFSIDPPPVTAEDYAGRVLSASPNINSGIVAPSTGPKTGSAVTAVGVEDPVVSALKGKPAGTYNLKVNGVAKVAIVNADGSVTVR